MFLFCFFELNSFQAFSQKLMHGYGLSFCSDFLFVRPEGIGANGEGFKVETGFSLFSASAELKYNLHVFNSDLALSAASSSGIGIMLYTRGEGTTLVGDLRIPIYIQLDYGALSTFESSKKIGIGIGLGYEYDIYGFFSNSKSFATPSARIGLRYFNRKNRAREVALRFGFPKSVPKIYS